MMEGGGALAFTMSSQNWCARMGFKNRYYFFPVFCLLCP